MSQTVQVPGVGTLQFPDDMSQADMAAAIKKNFPEIHAPAPRMSPADMKASREARYQQLQDQMVSEMPWYQKLAVGAGKAVYDTGRGIGELIGKVSPQDVAQARSQDAALMRTGAGKAGNALGYVGMAVPAMLAGPEVAALGLGSRMALGGAAGAAQGYAAPYASQGEHVTNALVGGGLGALIPGAAAGVKGVVNFGKHILAPESIAGENLARTLGDSPATINALRNAKKFLPGESPTSAQILATPRAVAAEKALRNNPDFAGKFTTQENANNAARLQVLRDLAGNDKMMESAISARRAATQPFIKENLSPSLPIVRWTEAAKPFDALLNKNMNRGPELNALEEAKKVIGKVRSGKMQEDDAIEELRHLEEATSSKKVRAAFSDAMGSINKNMINPSPVLKSIAVVRNGSLGTNPTVNKALYSIESQIKNAQNVRGLVGADLLDGIRQNASRILAASHDAKSVVGSQEEAGISPVKKQITDMLEKSVPGYRKYLETYAKHSEPINTMESARSILEPVDAGTLNAAGEGRLTLNQLNKGMRGDARRRYGMGEQAAQNMDAVRRSLQRESISNSLRVPGSDTNYNAQAQGLLARHLLGPTFGGPTLGGRGAAMTLGGFIGDHLGGLGGGAAGVAAGSALNHLSNIANQRIMRSYASGLLNPQEAARLIRSQSASANPVTNYLAQIAQSRLVNSPANSLLTRPLLPQGTPVQGIQQ